MSKWDKPNPCPGKGCGGTLILARSQKGWLCKVCGKWWTI